MKVQNLIFVVVCFYLAYMQPVKGEPRKDCQTRCGNVTIQYPFGISSGCYYPGDDSFQLTCEKERLYVLNRIEVIEFFHSGEIRIRMNISYSCYDSKNLTAADFYEHSLANLSLSKKNRLTAIGCNTFAFMTTIKDRNYSTGCLSLCDSPPEENGLCSGEGCCQTSVPKGSYHFIITSDRFNSETSINKFNPCFYAFLVEDGKFNFSSSDDLKNLRNATDFPVVLDWSIGNLTCKEVGSTSICGENSACSDSTSKTGYICTCNQGFAGNPYLSDGCQDINECSSPTPIHKHNCSDPKTCVNTKGSFRCKCPDKLCF